MTQSNYKFAITGGIGSGKSTVAENIRRQGFAVFSCDEIYSELLQNAEFVYKISAMFNGVTEDGILNRKKLSEKVFGDNEALKNLNVITHPAIMNEVFKRSEGFKLSFTEVPLLFENGFEKYFDGVIVVLRDKEERIAAVMQRNHIDKQSAILRIKSQFNYDICNFAQYYVIHNDGNLSDLKQKTVKIIEEIKEKYL